jgi:capsular polysaccharide biosynthesis protein
MDNYENIFKIATMFEKFSQEISRTDPFFKAIVNSGLSGSDLNSNQTWISTWNEIANIPGVAEKIQSSISKTLTYSVNFTINNNQINFNVSPKDNNVLQIVQKNFRPVFSELIKSVGGVDLFNLKNWGQLIFQL